MTNVCLATNRKVTNAQDAVGGYPAVMVPPLDPTQIADWTGRSAQQGGHDGVPTCAVHDEFGKSAP